MAHARISNLYWSPGFSVQRGGFPEWRQKLPNEAMRSARQFKVSGSKFKVVRYYETKPTEKGRKGAEVKGRNLRNEPTVLRGFQIPKISDLRLSSGLFLSAASALSAVNENYETNPTADKKRQATMSDERSISDSLSVFHPCFIRGYRHLQQSYQTKPCAWRAGSKFRVQSSKFCETKPTAKSNRVKGERERFPCIPRFLRNEPIPSPLTLPVRWARGQSGTCVTRPSDFFPNEAIGSARRFKVLKTRLTRLTHGLG
jgi:hypothetical protein